jgi:hypothetical protein
MPQSGLGVDALRQNQAPMVRDSLAIACGLGAFLILHIGYLFLEVSITNGFMAMAGLFFAAPVLAGGVTGYFAQARPLRALLVLGVAVAICVSMLHLLGPWLGFRNGVGGWGGSVTLGVFLLAFLLPMVVIGGAMGSFISRAHS